METFNFLLQQTSLKSTPQRLAILKIVEEAGHISIDDIYKKIKKGFPSISLATIYKNIHSLQKENILSEIKIQNQKSKFEIKKKPHSHFICNRCGEVIDIDIKYRCEIEELEKVGEVTEKEIYLYGICNRCKEMSKIVTTSTK